MLARSHSDRDYNYFPIIFYFILNGSCKFDFFETENKNLAVLNNENLNFFKMQFIEKLSFYKFIAKFIKFPIQTIFFAINCKSVV